VTLNLFNNSKRTSHAFENKRYESLQVSLERTTINLFWKHSTKRTRMYKGEEICWFTHLRYYNGRLRIIRKKNNKFGFWGSY
jgi:hypothetical protein